MSAMENSQEKAGFLREADSPEEPAGSQAGYEASVARVEEIIHRLDTGEASLSETLDLVREGKGLIERCARELEAVGGALEELRLEDLVARLESESAPGINGGGEGSR
jgi:exodeoxyribonuclease VII small subunit